MVHYPCSSMYSICSKRVAFLLTFFVMLALKWQGGVDAHRGTFLSNCALLYCRYARFILGNLHLFPVIKDQVEVSFSMAPHAHAA